MGEPLPLHAAHLSLGAQFAPFADRLVPATYGREADAYCAVRGGAGAIDLCAHGLILVAGGDAADLLHRVVTADVHSLRPGQGRPAAILSAIGRLVTFFTVYADSHSVVLDCPPELEQATLAALEGFVIMEDVDLAPLSGRFGLLSVQGPQAGAACARVLGEGPLPEEEYRHAARAWREASVRVVRRDRTGAGGFDLHVPLEQIEALFRALVDAGCPPVGWNTLQTLRIEAGIPWFGFELTHDTLPVDAGLAHLIDYNKGCFPGQEVMAKLLTRGHPARKLWGLRIEGETVPRTGDAVLSGGQSIGDVRSAADSPALGCPIALAILRWGTVEPGTTVTVSTAAGSLPAAVVELPFDLP